MAPRILHLRVAAGTGGGPEKTILLSPRFIKPLGYDAQVVYLCPPNDTLVDSLRERAEEAECPLTVLPDRGPMDLTLVMRLVRLCRTQRIDILQTHDYKSNALGLLVRRFHRCRMATMLHGWTDMSGRMPLYKKIDQWCLPRYEKLICVSEDLVDECHRLRIPASKIHLVHNAIDTLAFRRTLDSNEAKKQCDAAPNRFLIGSIGRLSPEKGFRELIRVVARLQKKGLPIDLWIAGEGSERESLRALIQSLECQGSIRLMGQIKDTRLFYQAMDLFVLNSIREGLPNVLLEAMALETPVIATAIAGIPRLIRSGETGRLIAPKNDDELEMAIQFSYAEPVQRLQMASSARKMIEAEFSFEGRMKKMTAIYDALCELRSNATG